MIAELETEKQHLDAAIQALERLSASNNRRRGRPPRWAKQGKPAPADADPAEEEEDENPITEE